jgi:hypothetical protein
VDLFACLAFFYLFVVLVKIAAVQATDWIDVDRENLNLPSHVALYVNDIFDYYKQREVCSCLIHIIASTEKTVLNNLIELLGQKKFNKITS